MRNRFMKKEDAQKKAKYLETLTFVLKMYNKKAPNSIEAEISSFDGLTTNLKYASIDSKQSITSEVLTDSLIAAIQQKQIYVKNPSFLNRFYKTQWYQNRNNY